MAVATWEHTHNPAETFGVAKTTYQGGRYLAEHGLSRYEAHQSAPSATPSENPEVSEASETVASATVNEDGAELGNAPSDAGAPVPSDAKETPSEMPNDNAVAGEPENDYAVADPSAYTDNAPDEDPDEAPGVNVNEAPDAEADEAPEADLDEAPSPNEMFPDTDDDVDVGR